MFSATTLKKSGTSLGDCRPIRTAHHQRVAGLEIQRDIRSFGPEIHEGKRGILDMQEFRPPVQRQRQHKHRLRHLPLNEIADVSFGDTLYYRTFIMIISSFSNLAGFDFQD